MSVRPVLTHADGSIDVILDELGHEGVLTPQQIMWGTNPDGTPNHNTVALECPDGCGTVSWHPVGGGADAPGIQGMFVDKVEREGCCCGNVEAATTAVPESHVHLLVSRMDGPDRWQLDDAPVVQAQAGPPDGPPAPKMFQVVYRTSDRLIVGTHPRGGVGPDHRVAVIHDMAEWEVLMKTDPAYLSADGNHILAAPE